MAGFRIEGNTSGNVVEVDVNHSLQVNIPHVETQAGFVMLAGEVSEAAHPAGQAAQPVRISTQGRLAVGQPVCVFNESMNSTVLDTGKLRQAATTQTITMAGGTLNLNASAITTLSTYSSISTYAQFPLFSDLATYALLDVSLSVVGTNNVTEIGFVQAATNAAPTDGAFFRYDTAGVLKAVLSNNSTEYTSAALTAPTTGVMHKYKVIAENDRVLFFIDNECQAIILGPTGLGMPTASQSLPIMARTINQASAPALANTVKIGYIYAGLQDAGGLGKDNSTIAAISGRMGSQAQAGSTQGSTAGITNSQVAGAGTAMTNTTAAAGTGLGGQFGVLPTLTVGTDGILCSYQNPVPTAALSGKTLYIKGVKISGVVTTALTGGSVVYAFSLAYGHTNVSLATTEGVGAKVPRRVPLGMENFASGAAVGTRGSSDGVYMPFNAPIAVNPGEFVAITAKNFGTVTTAGVIVYHVGFDSYWE